MMQDIMPKYYRLMGFILKSQLSFGDSSLRLGQMISTRMIDGRLASRRCIELS